MRSITRLVVHCSATPNGVYVADEQIDSWHRERGYSRDAIAAAKFRPHLQHIAFHRVIEPDGWIAVGRDIEEEASHSAGTFSICMVGTSAYFLKQWDALRTLVCITALKFAERVGHAIDPDCRRLAPETAIRIFRELGIEVAGHRDLPLADAAKEAASSGEWLRTCPGFDVRTWLDHGMEPEPAYILDGHPAIAQADPLARVMSSMRYGAL